MIEIINNAIQRIVRTARRIWASLTVRIVFILLLVMGAMGYYLSKSLVNVVTTTHNAERSRDMSKVVTRSIDGRLHRHESAVLAGAYASSRILTPTNSAAFCDSIRALGELDSVYISGKDNPIPEMQQAIQDLYDTNSSQWTEPYRTGGDSLGAPVVTFAVPLNNASGHIYAVLCGDVKLQWLYQLAELESKTDKSEMFVYSKSGVCVYSNDHEQEMTLIDTDKYDDANDLQFNFISGDTFLSSRPTFRASVDRIGWNVICSIPLNDSSQMSTIIKWITYPFVIFIFFIMALVITLFVRWQLSPLRTITDATEAISHGQFDAEVPVVKTHTDIRLLRDSFVRMQSSLQQYMKELQSTAEQKASIERDLAIASEIQKGMLPDSFPQRDDIDIYGLLRPAKSIGGDLFDFFMKDQRLYFCIGDVSGKGVPAALFMTAVGHLFRSIGRTSNNPADICRSISNGLTEGNEQNMFCTLFIGILDMTTGQLDYCNAGHNFPIYITGGNTSFLHTKINMPAGAFADVDYQAESFRMKHGDTLCLYTDGVTEAENRGKKLFGDDSMVASISRCLSDSMQSLANNLLVTVRQFADGAQQSDDITILCLKYK